jgi:acyl transferase domain-containing protein/NAD(P)H-dependent flavin oxidoreductase YrpB (nitropropane dioxygenase family)/short-subunit dehydrogenase
MSKLDCIAVTLPGLADPTVAIAASRAGGIGIVDVSFVRDEQLAVGAVARLARFARNRCGIRLDPYDECVADAVISALPSSVGFAILPPTDHDRLREQSERLRSRGVELWLEATTLDEARLAAALGFAGVIAKGHEAGGRVSETTTFILLQQFRSETGLPVWAQGGIGEHSVAACAAAGAAGVVLDAQLALTRESQLPDRVRTEIARMEGTETAWVGPQPGQRWRLYERPGHPAAEELRGLARKLTIKDSGPHEAGAWRARLADLVGWTGPENAWLLGQDAAFAARLAKRFGTVGGVLAGLRQAVDVHLAAAGTARPLAERSPLASSHGTRYPLVQGPMTRVSDVPGFAREVAQAGALPFLALALLRGPEVETLLRQTQRKLDGQPWGVGILGFVPHELRAEQLAVLQRYQPSFALIAGGRPDQALGLERDGVPAYLHVPSPGLLTLFVQAGARRFVFEGRECGGHIGPRTSFVLWDTMIDVLLASVPPGELPDCHVLFAGGVHDARSAAMVAAMAGPLVERGVKVGVLLGTAYLFTEEAVTTGAITLGFQQEAVRCADTVLLETGPGHLTRCADTPFAVDFRRERRRLIEQGCSTEEVRTRLELLNLGRARIASKGIDRAPGHHHNLTAHNSSTQGSTGQDSHSQAPPWQDPAAPSFVTLTPEEQAAQGMYMLGQVAQLRGATLTLAQLHHDVSVAGSALLDELSRLETARPAVSDLAPPCDIAVIGMGCLLPKAPDLHTYWENILGKVDAIIEIPPERWDWRRYFDPDPNAPDKIYSKWGGFLDEIPFDPVRYGMPPASLPSIDPVQLLTLEVVRAALDDAGYLDRPFARQQTGVIFGIGGAGDHGTSYGVRAGLPGLLDQVDPKLLGRLPTWTEDSFPGILLNVVAGRVANRFDLGGVNYTVDAACAASLAAVYLAVGELTAGTADMMIVGGADATQTPFGYLCFSKTHALSPRGRCQPLDAGADGIVISEGLGALVLKRLADAERDGDRIYAVIKGIGGSSDGRDRGLTAPRPEGQVLALHRAYTTAGFSPATVGLIEAHGTGTVAGDQAEITTLHQVFDAAGASAQQCAIGSVKSMIGHTKGTAGVAGLIKVALGLHHKVLPPTMGVEHPNPALRRDNGPFYINSDPRPWLRSRTAPPRRAGISAFGFGGTNFHLAVEEYTESYLPDAADAAIPTWPSELFLWTADSREELRDQLGNLDQALATTPVPPPLRELAHAVWTQHRPGGSVRLAIVARSVSDLRAKLAVGRDTLDTPTGEVWDRSGIYLTTAPLGGQGAIAFLYPGQGSQHPDMLRDLALGFPEVRQAFESADTVLADQLDKPLSAYVYPPPGFTPADEQTRAEALRRTDRAQPALGAVGMGLSRLLAALGVMPALTAGHSYGEYVALCAAGVFDEDTLYRLSHARGRSILDSAQGDLGTMAAVSESSTRVQDVLGTTPEVWVANINAPRQTVISGTPSGIERAIGLLGGAGISAKVLGVDCGFHSPLVAPARDRLAQVLADIPVTAPRLAVYANTSAAPYPTEPAQITELLTEHLVRPVRFAEQVEQLYAAGARLFVEVGPGAVLTGLVGQVLGTRSYLAVSTQDRSCGFTALQQALAQLGAHGVPLTLDRLYQGRVTRHLRLDALSEDLTPAPLPPTTWMVNGGSAHPRHASATQDRTRPPARSAPAHPGAPIPGASTPGPVPAPTAQVATVPESTKQAVPVPESTRQVVPVSEPTGQTQPDQGPSVLRFHQLMTKFLDVQQEVMVAYLRGSPPGPGPVANPSAQATPWLVEPPAPEPTPAQPGTPRPAAPESTTSSPAAPISATPEPPAADQVSGELVRLVAERTGYPPEMLGLDADMEADLGIDSIKRIEILAAAAQSLQLDSADQPTAVSEERMEVLVKARTLRALTEAFLAMDSAGGDGHAPQRPTNPRAEQLTTGTADEVTAPPSGGEAAPPRFLPTVVDAPIGTATRPLSGVIVITDDGQGIATALAESLRTQGIDVALIHDQTGPLDIRPDGYTASLGDASAVRDLIAAIRQRQGAISGLVHLLALRPGPSFEELDVAGQQARLDLEARSLLHLAQAARADLRRPEVAARLVAAVRIDGAFGLHRTGSSFQPGQGAMAGLVKTLAREWPQVRCTVIDLDPAVPNAVELLATELGSDNRQIEVGWSAQGRRSTIRLAPAALPDAGIDGPVITSDSVVLLVGGARGITSDVAREIARRYRPTIVLVGRSSLPEDDEAADTAGITESSAVKKALAARLAAAGSPVTPAQVEPAYRRLLADRQIRATLRDITAAGARVHYHQLDVRDTDGVAQLVEDLYATHGRIDGVVYGAGIIEDTLIENKTTESFDRVLQTKTTGAFALVRALRPDGVRFLALFSSISGRFGNPGQGDYAAANEVLNKLAGWLDARWPGRVVALNWGPWKTAGMVSAQVQRLMSQRGIQLITPEHGVTALIDELERGRKGDVEVLLGAGPWQVATPLLNEATITQTPEGTALTRLLDPDRDLYLRDHCLDGHPVLPMAAAMELMAETAAGSRPGYQVTELREVQLLRGVILDRGPQPITIRTTSLPPADDGGVAVETTLVDDRTGQLAYRAEVVLRPALPAASPAPAQLSGRLEPFPMTVEQAYDELLFHGPLLRRISRIEGITDDGMVAILLPSSPQHCLASAGPEDWIIDPVLLDSGFQLTLLWARIRLDMTSLPTRIGRYHRFAPVPDEPVRCEVHARARTGGHVVEARLAFQDTQGHLLALIEGMEYAASRALNRLAGAVPGGDAR